VVGQRPEFGKKFGGSLGVQILDEIFDDGDKMIFGRISACF